jgi:hypothetical protein
MKNFHQTSMPNEPPVQISARSYPPPTSNFSSPNKNLSEKDQPSVSGCPMNKIQHRILNVKQDPNWCIGNIGASHALAQGSTP